MAETRSAPAGAADPGPAASAGPAGPDPATSVGAERPAGAPAGAAAAARPQRVLIVEDEPALLRALRINMRARGYEVAAAASGQAALAEATRRPPDAVLLDLGLPDVDGVSVIKRLRTWSTAPVIVLSGRTGSGDKIGALDAGANDYVTKPFDIEELLARLRAALRRDMPVGASEITLGRWTIDLIAYTATAADGDIAHLTPTEWRLLEILLARPGQLVSARRMLHSVWGPGYERSTNYLRFHMARLRRKLEEDPSRPRYLLTEPGMGYRFRP